MSNRQRAGADSNAAGVDSRWNLAAGAGVGIGAAAVVCCGGTAIISTVGLGGLVGWLISPWLSIPIAGIGAAILTRRGVRRSAEECSFQSESLGSPLGEGVEE